MGELVEDIIDIALWLSLIAFVLGITVFSVGLGLSIGVYSGMFYAIRNYFKSVKENITHPVMKAVSYISLVIGVSIPLLFPVLIIVFSII